MITCHLQPPYSAPPPPSTTTLSFKIKTLLINLPFHQTALYKILIISATFISFSSYLYHTMEQCSRFMHCFFLFAVLFSILLSDLVVEGGDGVTGLCNADLSSFLPFPYSNLPNMVCQPLWNSYLLRVSTSNHTNCCYSFGMIVKLCCWFSIAVFQV